MPFVNRPIVSTKIIPEQRFKSLELLIRKGFASNLVPHRVTELKLSCERCETPSELCPLVPAFVTAQACDHYWRLAVRCYPAWSGLVRQNRTLPARSLHRWTWCARTSARRNSKWKGL